MIVFPTHIKEKSGSGSSWRCWSLENNIDTFFLEISRPLWLSRLQSVQLRGMFRSEFVKFLCSAPCLLLIVRNTCIVNKTGASVYCVHCQPYMYDFTLCLLFIVLIEVTSCMNFGHSICYVRTVTFWYRVVNYSFEHIHRRKVEIKQL